MLILVVLATVTNVGSGYNWGCGWVGAAVACLVGNIVLVSTVLMGMMMGSGQTDSPGRVFLRSMIFKMG